MLVKALGAFAVAVASWLVYEKAAQRRRRRRSPASSSPSPSPNGEPVHIVGSSVNLPDMSATLNAKVSVEDHVQQDPRLLAVAYDAMAQKFSSNGFNLAAIQAMQQYFSNLYAPGPAHPLHYSKFPVPLPPSAVRLCLVFFQRANPELASLVYKAAADVVAALPPGTKIHLNDPGHYHITVYMTSQPHTLCPSPLDPSKGPLAADLTPEEIWNQSVVTDFDAEMAVMRREAAETSPPSFKVHRLLMADSGTLLLCNVDTSGTMAGLRRRLRESFPGGPAKQSTIYHASVARVLSAEQLSDENRRAVQEVCDRWSDRLRGKEFKVDALHYVMEEKFTTVEGPAVRLPFKGID